jgi:hypothetical protein
MQGAMWIIVAARIASRCGNSNRRSAATVPPQRRSAINVLREEE